jgi:hypothetical protein
MFKDNHPTEYEKLKDFCKEVKILNYKNESTFGNHLEYFLLSLPNVSVEVLVGLYKDSWTKRGLEVRSRTYFINYGDVPYHNEYDKQVYKYNITESDYDTNIDETDKDDFIEELIESTYGTFSNTLKMNINDEDEDYDEEEDESLKLFFRQYFIAFLTSVLFNPTDEKEIYNEPTCQEWFHDIKEGLCEEICDWIKLGESNEEKEAENDDDEYNEEEED